MRRILKKSTINVDNKIKQGVRCAVLMMVRDEEENLPITLNTLLPIMSTLYLLDTGSMDRTLEVANDWCKKRGVELHLRVTEWQDFRKRNELLDFIRECPPRTPVDWWILADANDEFMGVNNLGNILETYGKDESVDAFYMNYHLQYLPVAGEDDSDTHVINSESIQKFHMIKIVRAGFTGGYQWRVHEILDVDESVKLGKVKRIQDNISYVYQNRRRDNEKTKKRNLWDYEQAMLDMEEHPLKERPYMTLAQICQVLGRYKEALFWNLTYIRRLHQAEMRLFTEERYGESYWEELVSGKVNEIEYPPVDFTSGGVDEDIQKLLDVDCGAIRNYTITQLHHADTYVVFMRCVQLLELLYSRGELKDMNRYGTALNMFTSEMLKIDPTRAEGYVYRANYYHICNRYDLAYVMTKSSLHCPLPTNSNYYQSEIYTFVRYSRHAKYCMLVGEFKEGLGSVINLGDRKTKVEKWYETILQQGVQKGLLTYEQLSEQVIKPLQESEGRKDREVPESEGPTGDEMV